MSIAWATITIVALLLPGAAFLVGFARKDKFPREIVRTGVLGEIALALLISMTIHLLLYFTCLRSTFAELLQSGLHAYEDPHKASNEIESLIVFVALYSIIISIAALLLGWAGAWLVRSGCLGSLSRYPWTNELLNKRGGVVTAYVMTKTEGNNCVLMYKGVLNDFYLNEDGSFSYIVLQNCSRYVMDFNHGAPNVGDQMKLFKEEELLKRRWNYLAIEGDNIANVLFDKIGAVDETKGGVEALEQALRNEASQFQSETGNQ
ncbi:hypothetical protein K9U40_18870 [Xanthobacter autotrophicus]|uniref:hypothetical protein n=1 Tax=Xanthobacter TaxID=279 RepID=UPI0024ABA8D9|nr:hypothetical protein [Xanthobacter autotrophicus]MDI4666370.1 hypothetical protein [Xanthobacter autotrophicus]